MEGVESPRPYGVLRLNRKELQQLAEDRILDAEALLAASRWSGAYYLTGYAVECGLKSCILAYVEATGKIFEDKEFSRKCWTHKFEELVKLAGLEKELSNHRRIEPRFDANWKVARIWTEADRYEQKTQGEAEKLCQAVFQVQNGVLQWIRRYW